MFFQRREGSHKGRHTMQTSNIAVKQRTQSVELKQEGCSIVFAEIGRVVTEKVHCYKPDNYYLDEH